MKGHVCAWAALALTMVVSAAGCSDDKTESYKCCVNGAYYNCRSSDEMATCGTNQMKCPRDSSGDSKCK